MALRIDNEMGYCLICCTKVKSSLEESSDGNQVENEVTNNLLSKNLNVIFILQQLLQLPSFHLKCNLLEYGDPENWISLCDQCTQLTGQAWNLHQQLVKITQQLNSVKTIIFEKAKSSTLTQQEREDYLNDLTSSPDDNNSQDGISSRRRIWRATREFIENNDYTETTSSVNPFIEGDEIAGYLASQQNDLISCAAEPVSSPQVKYDVEYNYPEDFEDDYLSPSPSSPSESVTNSVEQGSKFIHKFGSKTDEKEYPRRRRPCPKAPGGTFSCEVCGNTYKRNSHLIRHKRVIHKLACIPVVKPKVSFYICKICGKEIKSKTGLIHHINITHEKQWRFFCEICGMGRPNVTSLKMHMLAKHKEDPLTIKMMEEGERIWKCEVEGCAIQFFKKSTLDKHTEKYHGDEGGGEKRFKCEYCDVSFYRRSDLKRHGLVHEKKKLNRAFVCDVCGKGYGMESYLAIHKQSFH